MSDANFVIVDPSLRDFRGHHYMLSDLASRSAERAGMRVTWLVADPTSQIPKRENVSITPWFSMSMYDAYKPTTPNRKERGLLARLASFLSDGESRRGGAPDPADVIKPELQRAFTRFRDDDRRTRFFAHTADGAIYRALGALADEIASNQDIIVHVCTPYDPVGVMPNRGPSKDIGPAIGRLAAARVIGRQVYFHAENPYLAAHLSALWKTPVGTLEIPFAASGRERAVAAIGELRDGLGIEKDAFVISSLGPARLEKGFDKLPDIIRAWRAKAQDASAPPVHFALHAAPQIIGRDPRIAKALETIRAENDGSITLIEGTLSEGEYAALLDASDAVILPYDAEMYGVRSSGALAEALGAGKVIIARRGSYPARRIEPGAGECAETPAEYAAAMLKIVSDAASYRDAAAHAAARYARENSLDDYVKKIMRAEEMRSWE